MNTYIATVKILVAAPSLGDACDVVAGALSDPNNTALVDWSYIPRTQQVFGGYIPTEDDNTFTYPEPAPDVDLATAETFGYVEGSFLLTPD